MPLRELKFGLPVKGFRPYPAIQPRHLVGSLNERLWRARILPPEDLASNHTQQDDQQQTGGNAKAGEESDSHNSSLTLGSSSHLMKSGRDFGVLVMVWNSGGIDDTQA